MTAIAQIFYILPHVVVFVSGRFHVWAQEGSAQYVSIYLNISKLRVILYLLKYDIIFCSHASKWDRNFYSISHSQQSIRCLTGPTNQAHYILNQENFWKYLTFLSEYARMPRTGGGCMSQRHNLKELLLETF